MATLRESAATPTRIAHVSQPDNEASPSRRAQHQGHSRPASIIAPSVQFDEQNLLASPSAQREARGSRDMSAQPASPVPPSQLSLGSPATLTKSLHPYRSRAAGHPLEKGTASTSSLTNGQNLQRLSSRASAGATSSGSLNAGRSAYGSRKSRANPTIITVPVWARDESPSPPHSPFASPQAQSVPRSLHDIEPMSLSVAPDEKARSRSGSLAGPAGAASSSQQPQGSAHVQIASAAAATPEQLEEAEQQEAQSTSPDRWWTFTLPQKYRTRLHEHHLRMAFHSQRASEAENAPSDVRTAQGTPRKRGASTSREKKRRSTSSSNAEASSEMDSDAEMDDFRDPESRNGRHYEHGLGAESWNGVAAGLGASGLLNWKHGTPARARQQRQTDTHSAAVRRESPSPNGTSTTKIDDRDPEKQLKGDGIGAEGQDDADRYPTMSFRARMEHPDVYTVHQPATPGWASPWKPEQRGPGGFLATGYFPRTETGRTYDSNGKMRKHGWFETWKNFLIHNPFVPLLFRVINIAFTSATLAVAIEILIALRQEDANDAVGASPLVAIIFAPLSLVHVGFQIWLEYFGRPIGLWTVQSKLSYTVVELVFICLWSAELSLTFDNYFTSTLICVAYGSPYVGPRERPSDQLSPLQNPSRQPYLCRLQGTLIGLVFVSLLAYVIVLTVSLFRIFVRVTGGRRS
ncbi:hypothetical protein BCV70DRAFT_202977 [Testicularia cyperi]|uniref:Uncharacterized protein n=1 Tax=Testicularia cyperi TaxID=1882483 RepID=A0A317XHJ0_9BASI|nr:hypothetical protein BCV70DRAFT_202977 [Testicularia cyperi]